MIEAGRILGDDELLLQGRIQLEVARDALRAVGVNPSFDKTLTTILDVHKDTSDGQSQRDLLLYTDSSRLRNRNR